MKKVSLETSEQNVNEADRENYFEHKEIEGTPFHSIYQEDKGWFIVMGNHRLTEPTKTQEEAEAQISFKDWNFVTRVIGVITDYTIKQMQYKQ